MRILIATDAWAPQVNGVVQTLSQVVAQLTAQGHEVRVIHPGLFKTIPCPTYPEIRLALWPFTRLRNELDRFKPQAVHIVTEGPIGLAMRLLARGRETGAELKARIRRSQDLSAERLTGDMELVNGSSLDTSGRELLALLGARSPSGTP